MFDTYQQTYLHLLPTVSRHHTYFEHTLYTGVADLDPWKEARNQVSVMVLLQCSSSISIS